jgi:hypothetical protein
MSATIHGYLGTSNDEFDKAMGKFAMIYADQTELSLRRMLAEQILASYRKGEPHTNLVIMRASNFRATLDN